MIRPIARWFDGSVVQLGYLMQPAVDESNPRLQEAIDFLNGPDFIPADSQPAQLTTQSHSPRACLRHCIH